MFANRIQCAHHAGTEGCAPCCSGGGNVENHQFIWKGLDCPDHVQASGQLLEDIINQGALSEADTIDILTKCAEGLQAFMTLDSFTATSSLRTSLWKTQVVPTTSSSSILVLQQRKLRKTPTCLSRGWQVLDFMHHRNNSPTTR